MNIRTGKKYMQNVSHMGSLCLLGYTFHKSSGLIGDLEDMPYLSQRKMTDLKGVRKAPKIWISAR